jgi:hypothetical protein
LVDIIHILRQSGRHDCESFALSDTFAGIRPNDVPLFIAAQFAGGITATLFSRWLIPTLSSSAQDVVLPHPAQTGQ